MSIIYSLICQESEIILESGDKKFYKICKQILPNVPANSKYKYQYDAYMFYI